MIDASREIWQNGDSAEKRQQTLGTNRADRYLHRNVYCILYGPVIYG